jgi:hypothetical protein
VFRFRLLALLIFTSAIVAGQQIPIQFALTDTAGIELENRTVDVKATFTSDTVSIYPEYQEAQSIMTNEFGIASFWLGEGNATLSSSYNSINTDWLNPNLDYYIVIEIDSTGIGYEDLATIKYRLPLISMNALKSDSSDFALNTYFSDSSSISTQSISAIHSNTSDSSTFSNYSDTASLSLNAISSTSASFADTAAIAIQALKSDSASYSITSSFAFNSEFSDSSNHSSVSDTSSYSIVSDSSNHAQTSNYALMADHSTSADSSLFSVNSNISDYADTSGYALLIDPAAFNDSSSMNEIQSIEQVLNIDSNAGGKMIFNLNSLTIGDTVRSSAAIAINRNDAGLLLPRLTKIQRDVISNPEQGLMVYCTDCEAEGRVSVFDGNTWELLSQTNSSDRYAVISAGSIDNITVSGATFNGAISDSGGTNVFTKGFCLSSQPYPSLADVVIAPDLLDSSGVFRGRADYLNRNSKYYVRAYATNAAGTVYGPQQEFLTSGLLAVGDTFGGGIVGYILQPGDNGYDPGEQHGIIVANQNYGTLVDWGSCTGSVNSNGIGGTYLIGRTSELVFDAYYNDSIWNTICPDSLDQYLNYYSSLIHIVRDINWEGYNDWVVGTSGDYLSLFSNIELLNQLLTQEINNYYWTSSSDIRSGSYRLYVRFYLRNVVNSLTGEVTQEWSNSSSYKSGDFDYLARPIRYF